MGQIIKRKLKNENSIYLSAGVGCGYTNFQNEFLFDFRISAGAKELFIVMWALPNNYDFSVSKYLSYRAKELEKRNIYEPLTDSKPKKLSAVTVKKHLRELESAGYIKSHLLGYKRQGTKTIPMFQYELFEVTQKTVEREVEELKEKEEGKIDIDIVF